MAQEGVILAEAQVRRSKKGQGAKKRTAFERGCAGYCGVQDAFYVDTFKGVGRIYQQTFIETPIRKTPITAIVSSEEHEIAFLSRDAPSHVLREYETAA